MERAALLAEIEEKLAGRKVIWAGLRREDALPLADLRGLAGVFGIQGSFNGSNVEGVALEEITGIREDPEVWDIDDHLEEAAVREFRSQLLAALDRPSVLLPYRSSAFVGSLCFARSTTQHLGVFWGHLNALEHKPWVETSVAQLGIRTVPWIYVADEDQFRIVDIPSERGLVLRRSRTSGGEGFARVANNAEALQLWPSTKESFASVAPFVEGTPVNIGAVVWRDGVTVHHPSVQLIGIDSCTSRPFGYCGNDFGAARRLPGAALQTIDAWTRTIGDWLRANGFIGAYGVDYLVAGNDVWFTEINPRFQGSTLASCELDASADRSCLLTEHVAAWLGTRFEESQSLATQVDSVSSISSLVVHWLGTQTREVDAYSLANTQYGLDGLVRMDLVPPAGVSSRPGSTVARMTLARSITDDGFSIAQEFEERIMAWQIRESEGRLRL